MNTLENNGKLWAKAIKFRVETPLVMGQSWVGRESSITEYLQDNLDGLKPPLVSDPHESRPQLTN